MNSWKKISSGYYEKIGHGLIVTHVLETYNNEDFSYNLKVQKDDMLTNVFKGVTYNEPTIKDAIVSMNSKIRNSNTLFGSNLRDIISSYNCLFYILMEVIND